MKPKYWVIEKLTPPMQTSDLKRIHYFPQKVVTDQDYLKLPIDRLVNVGFKAHKKLLQLPSKGLNVEVLQNSGFSKEEKETVVLNLPTGVGKSETFYDLIKQYHDEEGYLVLVCSPYIKLVKKDVDALRGRGLDVFSYLDLNPGDGSFQSSLRAVFGRTKVPIHVMTINCLLRNPGKLLIEQKLQKETYLDDLIREAETNKKKVVIFIDELHESIEKFSRIYLPYLVKWKNAVQKIFVASATHTPGSVAIIQHLGRLTNNKISLFESERQGPDKSAAELFVHLTHKPYNKDNLSGLSILTDIMEKVENRPVHILCAHRDIADALKKNKTEKNPLRSFSSRFKLLLGGTEEPFDQLQDSIGTTFKTGVNINKKDAVFILILPSNPLTGYNGTFTDGVSSIIQVMGRLRKGGTYHVVMTPPLQLIEGTQLISTKGKMLSGSKEPEPLFSQNKLLDLTIENFQSKLDSIQEQINFLSKNYEPGNCVTSFFPSLQDLLVEESDAFCRKYLSGGRDPGAYLLWAACNEQFPTVKLKKVTLYHLIKQELDLGADNLKNIEVILNMYPLLKETLESCTIQQAYSAIINKVIDNPSPYKLTCKVKGTKISNPSKHKGVHRVILSAVTHYILNESLDPFKACTGALNLSFEKEYLKLLLDTSKQDYPNNSHTELIEELRKWRMEFFKFIEGNSVRGIHRDALRRFTPNFKKMEQGTIAAPLEKFRTILQHLTSSDPVFKSLVVNEKLQNATFLKEDQNLYLIARSLFTNGSRTNTRGNNHLTLSPGWQYV